MSCHHHVGVSANCICKSCGVFLCKECAIPLEFGYACSDSCRENIDKLEKHNQKNIQSLQDTEIATETVRNELTSSRKAHSGLMGFYILLALCILASGIASGDYQYPATFILILIVLTIFSFIRLKSIESVLQRLAARQMNQTS